MIKREKDIILKIIIVSDQNGDVMDTIKYRTKHEAWMQYKLFTKRGMADLNGNIREGLKFTLI